MDIHKYSEVKMGCLFPVLDAASCKCRENIVVVMKDEGRMVNHCDRLEAKPL